MQATDQKQNSSPETLQEQLERQYGPAVAQDIMDQLDKQKTPPKAARAPDYMDVKAMSEMAERLRAQAMLDVWTLREWRKAHGNTTQKNLINLEGMSLKRQCEESVKLYRHTHKTYFEMYRSAMDAFTHKAAEPYIISRYCA